MKRSMYVVLLGLLLFAVSFAQLPREISFQGKLEGVSSPVDLTFRIFDDATVGTELWSENHLEVPLDGDGLFNVILGQTNPIDIDFSEEYWIQVEVDGVPLPTRYKLTADAYSFRAIYADTAQYALSAAGAGIPSGAIVGFSDTTARSGWTYTKTYLPPLGQWTTKADMPTARPGLAAAVVDGKIYAIGGGSYLSTVEEYDPITDTWTTKADMPTARRYLAAAVVDGKIYAIGGYYWDGSDGHYLSTVEEYDPTTDTWTTKADMPTARSGLAVAVVDGKIYAIGGWAYGSGGYFSTVEEYDPITDTWTTKTDMLTERGQLAAAVVDGKIYAIGGYYYDGIDYHYLSTVEEYDPITDTWTTKADMPTERKYLAAAVVDGKIYAIGGHRSASNSSPTVEEYDPITNWWTIKANMPKARYGLAAAAVNGKIYAIGGYGDNGYLSTVEEYDPSTPDYIYFFRKD